MDPIHVVDEEKGEAGHATELSGTDNGSPRSSTFPISHHTRESYSSTTPLGNQKPMNVSCSSR
jgi:hypothetical protein